MNVFSIFLGFGASIGLACAALQAQPTKRSARLIDAGLITLAAALVGGRAGYVLVNWGHFQAAPLEIPQVWLGGFTGLGAAAGGLAGLLLASALLRALLGALADDLLPLVPPLAVSAWLACMQTGVAYGAAAPGDWWAVPLRDEAGFITPRMPLQPLAAGLTLLLFTLLEAVRPRLPAPGQRASLALLGTALVLFGTGLLRADPSPLWRGLRWDVLGSAALALASLVGFAAISLAGKVRLLSRTARMNEMHE